MRTLHSLVCLTVGLCSLSTTGCGGQAKTDKTSEKSTRADKKSSARKTARDSGDKTPGAEAVQNKWQDLLTTLEDMDEASMKKHWKRYYQEAISGLKHGRKELQKKRIEYRTQLLRKEKGLAKEAAMAAAAKSLLRKCLQEYKQQRAEQPNRATYTINGEELPRAQAVKRLKDWGREYRRKYSSKRLATKVKIVRLYRDLDGRTEIAIAAYSDHIQALEDQLDEYEVQLALVGLRDRLTALSSIGGQLDSAAVEDEGVPGLDRLSELNASVEAAIARSEAESKPKSDALARKFASLEARINEVGSTLSDEPPPVLGEIDGLD